MELPPQKPLTYLSALCVLPYINVELRLKFCERCPSIRYTDSCIPMKLDRFEIGNHAFVINKTTYGLDLVRHHVEAVPSRIEILKSRHQEGANGLQEVLKIPGPTQEETNQNFHNEKKLCQLLKWLKEENQNFRYRRVEDQVGRLRKLIRDYKEKLAFSRAKIDHYFVLTHKVDKTVTKEYVRYARSYMDALRYLTEKVLGGRKIRVEQLNMVDGLTVVSPRTLTIEAKKPKCVIKIKGRRIVSIRFPTGNNACFTDFRRPQFISAQNSCMLLTFRVAADMFDETMRTLIDMMEKPLDDAQKEGVLKITEKQFPAKFNIRGLYGVVLEVEVKDIRGVGVSGEDYLVKIDARPLIPLRERVQRAQMMQHNLMLGRPLIEELRMHRV